MKTVEVIFTASDSIVLLPGFTAKPNFTAKIGPNVGKTRHYVNGIEYFEGEMEAIYHEVGRVFFDSENVQYEYRLLDHLGNLRVLFSDDGTGNAQILQSHSYYPFGMQIENLSEVIGANENQYQFSGKELNTDFGLNWIDYGGRWRDPTIGGGFVSVDPLAELEHNLPLTPYHYAANNPIVNVDPDGLNWYRNDDSGAVHWQEGDGDVDGHTNLGAYYIMEGNKDFIVHYQNEVIATVDKSQGDYETAYTRQYQHMTVAQEPDVAFDAYERAETMMLYGELVNDAILIYAPIPKASQATKAFGQGAPYLRQAYVKSVKKLERLGKELLAKGHSKEQVARALHAERRALGVKYKDLTPPELLNKIYERNVGKYGDKLGPSIEYLRGKGKSWDDIIQAASKPGGKDVKFK